MLVVEQQIVFSDSVSEVDDFKPQAVESDAFVAVLAEDERLTVLKFETWSSLVSRSVAQSNAPSLNTLQF